MVDSASSLRERKATSVHGPTAAAGEIGLPFGPRPCQISYSHFISVPVQSHRSALDKNMWAHYRNEGETSADQAHHNLKSWRNQSRVRQGQANESYNAIAATVFCFSRLHGDIIFAFRILTETRSC